MTERAGSAVGSGPVEVPIRDAASVILVRRSKTEPEVLMGQRGAAAVFMPSKFVFPGGAVDPGDFALAGAAPLAAATERRLRDGAEPGLARALAVAAVRELWEETGLALGRPDGSAVAASAAAAEDWRDFLAAGLRPRTEALRFIFRAVTPPGRPRRFDARFFLAEAAELAGDLEDFSRAGAELAHLHWVALGAARALALPFITGVVLSEFAAILTDPGADRPVPFFHHDAAGSHFSLL